MNNRIQAALMITIAVGVGVPTSGEAYSSLKCREWRDLPVSASSAYVRGLYEGYRMALVVLTPATGGGEAKNPGVDRLRTAIRERWEEIDMLERSELLGTLGDACAQRQNRNETVMRMFAREVGRVGAERIMRKQ